MAVSLSVIAAKDSAGTAIAGGLQAQDKSGAGTGPFTLGQVLIDGVAGVNMAGVTAANAVKVDGSAVTQPVSVASLPSQAVTNIGTFAVQPDTSVVQNSSTSGQKGALSLAAVTTSAPTYTNGQTSPFSLDTTGALRVNVTAGGAGGGIVTQATAASLNATVVGTGTFAVQAAATLAAETTKVIGVARTADGAGNLLTSTANALDINIKSGANVNGSATSANSAPVVIASDQGAVAMKPAAAATGGATNLHFFSVTGAPAAVVVKASAGTLYGVQAVNTGAAPVYLKLYNVAAASVTVGTTVPLVTIPVPTVATTGAGISATFPVGIVFGTAMSYTFTNVAADNDATAVAVGTTLNVQFA